MAALAAEEGPLTEVEGEAALSLSQWLSDRNIPESVLTALQNESITLKELLTYTCDDLEIWCKENSFKISIRRRFVNAIKEIPGSIASSTGNSNPSQPYPPTSNAASNIADEAKQPNDPVIKPPPLILNDVEQKQKNRLNSLKTRVSKVIESIGQVSNDNQFQAQNTKQVVNQTFDKINQMLAKMQQSLLTNVKLLTYLFLHSIFFLIIFTTYFHVFFGYFCKHL